MTRTRFHPAGSFFAVLCAAAMLACATPAAAADRAAQSEAQATWARDRAACMSKTDDDERKTCLREAGAALQESRRDGLTDEAAQFEKNRLARCDYQPPKDRPECIKRMNEGTVTGSVQSGAILRELRTFEMPDR